MLISGTVHWFPGSIASFCGGFCAGVVTNPVDIVYNRQAAEALFPTNVKRNYRSFLDGIVKVHAEGALFRGAVASGWSYGMLLASMSYVYDYLKEYMYWIFGPTHWLRPLILIPTAYIGTCLYLPFDNVKVRYHTMTALPNGEMPYKGFVKSITNVHMLTNVRLCITNQLYTNSLQLCHFTLELSPLSEDSILISSS